jgi:adenosine deaminase
LDLEEFLRRIPKVELHCHVEGAVRPATLAELATANDVPLPPGSADDLYHYEDLEGFLRIYELVCRSLRRREDFERVAYESLEDGVRTGALRYREMFFNPTLHTREGVAYVDVVDGLLDGIHAARTDLGVECRLIPSVYRQDPVEMAGRMLEEVLAERRDEVIGIGLDGDELLDPPEKFTVVFRAAASAGLRRTAHASHDAPAAFITTCLDVLGVDRVDHGYHVLDDEVVLARTRDDGVAFTASLGCPPLCGWPPEVEHTPIKQMRDRGLRVTLHTDDPTMLHTDVGTEYVRYGTAFGLGPAEAKALVLEAVDMAWLDDDERRRMRADLEREIDELAGELEAGPGEEVREAHPVP